jgi:hypothetical protein
MEKRDETWAFFATDSDGNLDGDVDGATCARCHASAPADHLFGLPRATGSRASDPAAEK